MVEPVQRQDSVERFLRRGADASNQDLRVQRERIERLRDRTEVRQTAPVDPLDPAPLEQIENEKGQNLDLIA